MSVITIDHVTKCYGKTCALDNISLKVEPNKIYGLLGRNGAGKTTLLNLITNRLFPTEGKITIDDKNVIEKDDVLGKVYYMSEMNLYPEGDRVKTIFKWTKEFYPSFNLDYAFELCEKFGLNPNKKIKSLSTGYNSIAKIISALATHADILIFDEPVLGLDAYHRDLFYKELLASYIERPKTIILSTHIIEEIADILEKIVIIKDKKIVVDESVENLLERAYCISGSADSIDQYIKDKQCIHIDQMASFRAATIIGDITDKDKEMTKKLNLKFSKVELQKLFIYLTSEGGMEQ